MLRTLSAIAATALAAAAPTVALAANYYAVQIDRTALVVTDLRAPTLMGGQGEVYEITIYRAPEKAKKGAADYRIVRLDLDCAGGKQRAFYISTFSLQGALVKAVVKPGAWTKIAPASRGETFKGLACSGAIPHGGFAIGDFRIGQIAAQYRAGAYDRYIH